MAHAVMLVPSGNTQGIFTVALGLVKALNRKGVKTSLFNPLPCCKKCCCKDVFGQIAAGRKSEYIENILAECSKLQQQENPELIIVQGITSARFDKDEINADICHALDADIVTVTDGVCEKACAAIKNTLRFFGNAGVSRVLGTIAINTDAPASVRGRRLLTLSGCGKCACSVPGSAGGDCGTRVMNDLLAEIKYDNEYYAPRAADLAEVLSGSVLGDPARRGYKLVFAAADADKDRKVLLTADAEAAKTSAAGIVILAGTEKASAIEGRSVIATPYPVWDAARVLDSMCVCLPEDDTARRTYIEDHVSELFNAKCLDTLSAFDRSRVPLMSPEAFRYKLTELARAAHKRIALPEGDEPRTVKAAAIVAEQNIAVPVLIGNKEKILAVAAEQHVTLGDNVEFVEPDAIREKYVDRLVELRSKKGVTPESARDLLKDNVFLATMMIDRGEVDGLVSGAVHTTANTIRPPLQIIKTAPNAKLVSAIFFMLMPEQVYVYGDCALNINPTADELSEIAIQSADSAKAFGIDPRVAMVTYSTMNSGKGADVDLMAEATRLVREKRPDIPVDGPLQYDAAVMPDVAAQKAPGSSVAGKATVFIFPSLSTGNTVYKAVQRSANLISIGPMLQGMKKPVNDLSRGALVDDIVYTIAVTAIQATQA